MPSKNSTIIFQHFNKLPTISNSNSNNDNNHSTTEEQNQDERTDDNDVQSPNSQRRLPLPNKLTFEQNITNLIEKESPLLQSELLTAEHELSVLRSRLAVNEGVTAVTGSILESLKGQFEREHKFDKTASPLNDIEPESIEIYYDKQQATKVPYLIIKAIDSYWIAQPINENDIENHLKSLRSPIIKRAIVKTSNENRSFDRAEQTTEAKPNNSLTLFHNTIDDIYSIINNLKVYQFNITVMNNLKKKLLYLKFYTNKLNLTKQNKLNFEYYYNQIENIFNRISTYEYEQFIDLLKKNLLQIKNLSHHESKSTSFHQRLIPESPVVTSEVFFETGKVLKEKKQSKRNHVRLIPESARISAESFYEGDVHRSLYNTADQDRSIEHSTKIKKDILIPEKPLVSGEVFYEGDPQRSMFVERSSNTSLEKSLSIENLRSIMSDLMLAASWSVKPTKYEEKSRKDDNEEILIESFLTTEQQLSNKIVCEIIHDVENLSLNTCNTNKIDLKQENPIRSDTQHSNTISQSISSTNSQYEDRLVETANQIVNDILNKAVEDIIQYEQDQLYSQAAVQLVDDVLNNILTNHDQYMESSSSSDDSETYSSESSSLSSSDEEEENMILISEINNRPYLDVSDIITSKSTQELSNLVHELHTIEDNYKHIRSLSLSSSDSSDDDQIPSNSLFIPEIITTKSFNELNNLVNELEYIEEQIEDKYETSKIENIQESKSFNELGGLINELSDVSKKLNNRIYEELFTVNNIDSLSHDIVKYRRDSQINEKLESQVIDELINKVLKEAQSIIAAELSNNQSIDYIKPKITVEQHLVKHDRLSTASISDDLDFSHEENVHDRRSELADQLDYLRRMSRYENYESFNENIIEEKLASQLVEQALDDKDKYERKTLSNRRTISEYHIPNSNPIKIFINHSFSMSCINEKNDSTGQIEFSQENSSIEIENFVEQIQDHSNGQQYFQTAIELYDDEKSKLVRSPEIYHIDHVIDHEHRSLSTNPQIQYRTLSESALTVDEKKSPSGTATASNEASVEFLTTISHDDSLEFLQQQRLSTPYDDVREKESSPEHSDSYNIPLTAFSDTYEPTSSCQRPLALCQTPTDIEQFDTNYQILNDNQSDSSSSHEHERINTSSDTDNDDDDDNNNNESSSDNGRFPVQKQYSISNKNLNPIVLISISNIHRDDSSDFAIKDPIEKMLRENILRSNLQTFENDSINNYNEHHFLSSIENDTKNLLDDLINIIVHDLTLSISIEPLSSISDATTVIDNSKIQHSISKLTSNSLSSSSHSVIYIQQNSLSQLKSNSNSSVYIHSKRKSSIPSFSNVESISYDTKRKYYSYPSSLGTTQIYCSSIGSIPNDYYSNTTTSTTNTCNSRN